MVGGGLNLNLCSWVVMVARNNLCMIIQERSTSIVFSAHLLSSLKNLIFMFNNLTKLTTILTRKDSMQLISPGVLRFLISIKNLGQCKNLSLYKFVKKKRTFRKAFHSM